MWKNKGTKSTKTIMKTKNKVGSITVPNFKTYYMVKKSR